MIGAGVPGGADQLPPQDGGQAGGAVPHVLARRPDRRRSDTQIYHSLLVNVIYRYKILFSHSSGNYHKCHAKRLKDMPFVF